MTVATKEAAMTVRELCIDEERKYLDEKGKDGGNAVEYRQRVQDRIKQAVLDDPDYWLPKVTASTAAVATSVWEREGPPPMTEQGDMFVVNNRTLPGKVTVPDPEAPRGYRKVAMHYATIGQHKEHGVVRMRVAAKAMAAAEATLAQNDTLVRRANGDLTQLVIDHAERLSDVEYGDETDEDEYR